MNQINLTKYRLRPQIIRINITSPQLQSLKPIQPITCYKVLFFKILMKINRITILDLNVCACIINVFNTAVRRVEPVRLRLAQSSSELSQQQQQQHVQVDVELSFAQQHGHKPRAPQRQQSGHKPVGQHWPQQRGPAQKTRTQITSSVDHQLVQTQA